MAYDEGLAQRIREQLGSRPGLTEKKMFGGVAFLVRGSMAVGVIGDDLIARVDPADYDAALRRPGARLFDLTGKPMRGWLVVDGAAIEDDEALGEWLDAGVGYAASLPPKPAAGPPAPSKPKQATKAKQPTKPKQATKRKKATKPKPKQPTKPKPRKR